MSFGVCIFLSAFLLFLIQPMFAKLVLPQLGGTAQVWNTCVFFFQVVLLLGYFYSHILIHRPLRFQARLHSFFILIPIFFLPIAIPSGWAADFARPITSVLILLVTAVGAPFFILSTTSPLLQKWFSSTPHRNAKDPYFLYAASNVGSLLALLGYPVLIEPRLTLHEQSQVWSWGYALFGVVMIVCAMMAKRFAVVENHTVSSAPIAAPLSRLRIFKWIFFAFVPSSLSLGVTNYISTDIAPMPLIWIVPLALYLITFILVFSTTWARRVGFFLKRFPGAVVILATLLATHANSPLEVVIPAHLLCFFIIALYCHSRLAEDRPQPQWLTHFYVCLSVGGGLGGLFNALVAPVLFSNVFEYPMIVALSAFLLKRDEEPGAAKELKRLAVFFGVIALAVAGIYLSPLKNEIEMRELAGRLIFFAIPAGACFGLRRIPRIFPCAIMVFLIASIVRDRIEHRVMYQKRDFFGVSTVERSENGQCIFFRHGSTIHGVQYVDSAKRNQPTAYYYHGSPIAQIFHAFNNVYKDQPSRVAIVGLGAGGLIGYSQPPQEWVYYEISPVVIEVAENPKLFTFLSDAKVKWRTQLGDGRLEIQKAEDASFDFILIDAFSSDAIPVHLLTREATELYLRKLKPNGLLVFHISNRYLDLEPVLGNLAKSLNLESRVQFHTPPDEKDKFAWPSQWVMMGKDNAVMRDLDKSQLWSPLRTRPDRRVWTDDYSNVLQTFKRMQGKVPDVR